MALSLSDIIIQRIQKDGAISFRDFMEMALYYSELGYYTSSSEKIGKEGDYFTSLISPASSAKCLQSNLRKCGISSDNNRLQLWSMAPVRNTVADILQQLKKQPELYDHLNITSSKKCSDAR